MFFQMGQDLSLNQRGLIWMEVFCWSPGAAYYYFSVIVKDRVVVIKFSPATFKCQKKVKVDLRLVD